MNKIYAYVTSENCCYFTAFRPGEEYQGQPVSRHGDLRPWQWGKRETLAMATDPTKSPYLRQAATHVASMIGWSD